MMMQFISLRTFLLVQFCICTCYCDELYEGNECDTDDNQSGICTRIKNCPSLFLAIQTGKRQPGSYTRCSFIRDEEVVCCPKIALKFYAKRKAEEACERYTQQSLNFYILNGTLTKPGEFPHMAGIVLYYQAETQEKITCGGALISEQYVLTAGHCVGNPNIIPRRIRFGSVSLQNSSVTENTLIEVEVEEVIFHPSYTPKYTYHDIALIKLNWTVTFNANVRPACLYTDTTRITEEQALVATGWGLKDIDTKEKSDDLLKVDLHLVNIESCNSTYYQFGYHGLRTPQGFINTQICAFSKDSGDTCQGDSGGPLQMVQKNLKGDVIHIVGVVSYGPLCGGFPGVYTNVTSYLDWIESVVWP